MKASAAMLEYYADASQWGVVEMLTPSGDEFWRVKPADVQEFPSLATTFGVQLTPTGRLVLHATPLEYMAAVAVCAV